MEEKFVDLKTGILAKEKGFDWKCLRFKGIIDDDSTTYDNWNRYENSVSKPTLAHLQMWFRKVHSKDVFVIPYSKGYANNICNTTNNQPLVFNSYEEALEVGMVEELKKLNSK